MQSDAEPENDDTEETVEDSSVASQLADDLSGQTLNDFLILRRLGQGGMADVFLAQQQSLNRQVAIKVLRRQYASDDSYIRRFRNEALAAAALVHPNIVQIFEVGKSEGRHFIAQEYVRGQNLKQFMQKHGALDPFLAINIIRQVSTALQKAGEGGIVHRDIKPENIMLSGKGEIKVADFGLARLTADPKATDLTQIGITMGTPLYMSPEQIECRPVDQRTDIYSLGITCYQLLAGRPPFDGETALAVAVQHLKQDAVSLGIVRPDLPDELCRIVHKMMNKNPDDRYPDGATLLRDLLAIKIDSSETEWSAALEKVSLSEAQALYSTSRLEATRQLEQALGKRSAPKSNHWLGWLFAGLACLAAATLGWLIPRWHVPESVLADVQPVYEIVEQESVRKQYHHAYMLNTEDAWLAIAAYFPDEGENARTNRHYANLATVRLAGMYLVQGDLEKAQVQYEQLRGLERKIDENFRHIGLAGSLIVAHRMKNEGFVREHLQQVLDHQEMCDRTMRDSIQEIRDQLESKSEA